MFNTIDAHAFGVRVATRVSRNTHAAAAPAAAGKHRIAATAASVNRGLTTT